MNTQDFKRKLAAVFSADVAGYSRLMGDDERATVDTITSYRSIMTDLIRVHNGRVVDSPEDNLPADPGGICGLKTDFDNIDALRRAGAQ
jgi:class 3 adenylate cyclase